MLGSHPSYARGARNQVQQFRPENIAEVEFRRRMEIVRGISEHWQGTVGAAACNRPPRPLTRPLPPPSPAASTSPARLDNTRPQSHAVARGTQD